MSQFTLYHIMKGNKPDFHLAMGGEAAKEFYEQFLAEVAKNYGGAENIKNGKFGAMMTVDLANNGPVTMEIESPLPASAAKDAGEGASKN